MKKVILAALLLWAPAARALPPRPVLVEMFVSQSCSSCPPADALLRQLAAAHDWILPLSLNVDYFNDLGWKDTDSLKAATDRQLWYARLAGSQDVYTPEAVVDGVAQVVGSDRDRLMGAIRYARSYPAGNVPLSITGGAMLKLDAGAGDGSGQIFLIGYDSRHDTHVGGGENRGKTVTEINVVRSVISLGPWLGQEEKFTLSHPAGQHVALILQAKSGAVLGLATQ